MENYNYKVKYCYSSSIYGEVNINCEVAGFNPRDRDILTYKEAKKVLKKVIEKSKDGRWTSNGKFYIQVV